MQGEDGLATSQANTGELLARQINLKDIFQAHGNKVCMVAPERMDCLPTLVSKLQRDLMELHTTTVFDKNRTTHPGLGVVGDAFVAFH